MKEGIKAKAHIYCFRLVILLSKSVQGEREGESENHQIWGYVLYGWSLFNKMFELETIMFTNNWINYDMKDIWSSQFFYENSERLQMLFYTKHWFSK